MTALFGGGSGQSNQQKQITTAQTNSGLANLNTGASTTAEATSALQQPLDFFKALLSGDRNTIMSALSPEISTLSSQYNTGEQTAEEFAPRGGGRAATLESLPFQKAGQIETLVEGAQSKGATGVTDIGQLLGELGLNEQSLGLSGTGTAFNEAQAAKENAQTQQTAAGSAVGSLIGLLVGALPSKTSGGS